MSFLREKIKSVRLPLILDFIRWLLIDLYRRIRDGRDRSVYGVYAFCGLHGYGKTLSMVRWIQEKKKIKPDLKVYTNFFMVGQTGELKHWSEIIDIAVEGNAIIAIDEAHLTFNSRSWKDFPIEMIEEVSQNRKTGVQFLMSAQVFDDLDKTLRTQTHYVVSCKNFGKRLFLNVFYRRPEYERSIDKRKPAFRQWFVSSDALRGSYDTMQKVKSLKGYKKQDVLKVDVSSTVSLVESSKKNNRKRS